MPNMGAIRTLANCALAVCAIFGIVIPAYNGLFTLDGGSTILSIGIWKYEFANNAPTPTPTPTPAALPAGSYQATCEGCTYDKNYEGDFLTCSSCDGSYQVQTSLNIDVCQPGTDIYNNDGQLDCNANRLRSALPMAGEDQGLTGNTCVLYSNSSTNALTGGECSTMKAFSVIGVLSTAAALTVSVAGGLGALTMAFAGAASAGMAAFGGECPVAGSWQLPPAFDVFLIL